MNLRNRIRKLLERSEGKFDWRRWHARRVKEWVDALEKLIAIVPESRHEALGKLLREGPVWQQQRDDPKDGYWPPRPIEIDNPGLAKLLILFLRGDMMGLNPPVMPVALVDAYLNDPRLEPHLRCPACGLWLPYCSGFWASDVKPDQWWQAPCVPFERCPVCDVEVWGGSQKLSWVPRAATPGWTFRSYEELPLKVNGR